MCKTIFFHNRNDFTGSTRVLADVIESSYAGKPVTIVAIDDDKGFLSNLPNCRILHICFPRLRGAKIPYFTNFVRQVHALLLTILYGWRYDVFYINTITPAYAAIVGQLYRKKIIYHIHEKYVVPTVNAKLLEYVFNHTKARRIFVSQYVMNQYPTRKDCVSIVKYNSLTKSFLDKVKVTPIGNRSKNTIILIASLSKVKGIHNYIAVARKLPVYTFRLMISSDIDSIRAFIGSNLPQNVDLIPAQSNIHPYLSSSDLIMNLTIPFLCVETFGMTILEGMAYGLPAIVPNIGGPTELVKSDYNGYCIDVTDVDLVAETVKKALEEGTYERLAYNALERVKEFINTNDA